MFSGLKKTWNAYWFSEAGYSIACCRIALCYILLHDLNYVQNNPHFRVRFDPHVQALYSPVGILKLLGDLPLNPAFLSLTVKVAHVSTILTMVGLFTRVSLVSAVISNLILNSMQWVSQSYWSHGFNVEFLAAIAFVGARGTRLSLDSLIRRLRASHFVGDETPFAPGWPVMLGQFATAWMFASACFQKIRAGDGGLGWAFSDNLRNALANSWYWYRDNPPSHVLWVMEHEWAWKSLALGNLIAQALPFAACFLIRYPRLRALGAVAFTCETIGLGVLFQMWHPWWLPLTAFFIDWDRLLLWIGDKTSSVRKRCAVILYFNWETVRRPRLLNLIAGLDVLGLLQFTPLEEAKSLSGDVRRAIIKNGCGVETPGGVVFQSAAVLRIAARLPLAWPVLPLLYLHAVVAPVGSPKTITADGAPGSRWIHVDSIRFPGRRTLFAARTVTCLASGYILLFCGYSAYVTATKIDHQHLLYPFSSFSMFSDIKDQYPYNQHTGHHFYLGQVAADLPTGKGTVIRRPFSNIAELYRLDDFQAIKKGLEVYCRHLQQNFNLDKYPRIELGQAIYHVPCYPAPAKPVVLDYSVRAVLNEDGTLQAANVKSGYCDKRQQHYLEPVLLGFTHPEIRFEYKRDVRWLSNQVGAKPVKGQWVDGKYYIEPEEGGIWHIHLRVKEAGSDQEFDFIGPDHIGFSQFPMDPAVERFFRVGEEEHRKFKWSIASPRIPRYLAVTVGVALLIRHLRNKRKLRRPSVPEYAHLVA